MLSFKVWLLNLKPIGSGVHKKSEEAFPNAANNYDYITVVGEAVSFFSKQYLLDTSVFVLLFKQYRLWSGEKRREAIEKW